MDHDPFLEMQKAVDIVNSSQHPTNKIAASLFGRGLDGQAFSIAFTNFWPDPILARFGTETRIGSSSGTVHAETACIITAPYTFGAAICITDPFCPNCAKNMAEAGIRTIYIDHKGFNKDFAERRGAAFENMSMQICERAGIDVYRIHRKEERIETILKNPDHYTPVHESPVMPCAVALGAEPGLKAAITNYAGSTGLPFTVALARDDQGALFSLAAHAHPTIGYASHEADRAHGKYSLVLEPVNRILMNASRYGLALIDGHIYCSHVPTARELVNLVGAGLSSLQIGDIDCARDTDSITALRQLQDAGILRVSLAAA